MAARPRGSRGAARIPGDLGLERLSDDLLDAHAFGPDARADDGNSDAVSQWHADPDRVLHAIGDADREPEPHPQRDPASQRHADHVGNPYPLLECVPDRSHHDRSLDPDDA